MFAIERLIPGERAAFFSTLRSGSYLSLVVRLPGRCRLIVDVKR